MPDQPTPTSADLEAILRDCVDRNDRDALTALWHRLDHEPGRAADRNWVMGIAMAMDLHAAPAPPTA